MKVKVTFEIDIPDKSMDVNTLSAQIRELTQKKTKELFCLSLERYEASLLRKHKRRIIKRGKVPRTLITPLGKVKIKRYQVMDKKTKQRFYLLDRYIGLNPYQRITLGVEEKGLRLSVEYPYKRAEELMGGLASCSTLHRRVQREGKRIREEENALRNKVFKEGKGLEMVNFGEAKGVLVTAEADDTGIPCRDGKEWMGIKLGVYYWGKALRGKNGDKNRYMLIDKSYYGGIETSEEFGQMWAIKGIEEGVGKARYIYLIGDGALWIKKVGEDYLPNSIYQLDWWHLNKRIMEVFGGQKSRDLMEDVKAGRLHDMLSRVKRSKAKDEQKKKELISYIKENWEGIEGYKKVKELIGEEYEVSVGSGAIEKGIEIVICRRFKKQGMSWSREGANNLLKLRLLKLNGGWSKYWQARAQETGADLSPN